MRRTVVRIERVAPRDGLAEEPELTRRGYKLGDPRLGHRRHHAEHAVFVTSLDEVAEMLQQGFALWMVAPGRRASLISPKSLRIVRRTE